MTRTERAHETQIEHARSDLLFPANRAAVRDSRRAVTPLDQGLAIDGLIHLREGALLYVLAQRAAPIGDVVEIGAYKGRSTWYLAQGLKHAQARRKVISIDPQRRPDVRQTFEEMVAAQRLVEWIDPHFDLSHNVALAFPHDHPVGLVWIDGDHHYDAVRQDFEDWFPRLAVGGWVAIHDTVNNFEGPTKLTRELLSTRTDLRSLGIIYMTFFAQKVPARPANRLAALTTRASFELLTLLQARHAGFGPQKRG